MSTGPDPGAPRTIGDAIRAKTDAEGAKKTATDALAAANQALTDATDTDARAYTELAADLAQVGAVFHPNADTTAEVFISDSASSYHHFTVKPDSTPVETPAPTPTPTPAPGPGPALAPAAESNPTDTEPTP